VDKVLIAGSFGYHLREKSLINIGLLPKEFEGKVEFVGNTSLSGAKAFLLNQTYREKMKEMVKVSRFWNWQITRILTGSLSGA